MQAMGCRRGIWGAEVGCRTQEIGCGFCRNAKVGFRVQIWDDASAPEHHSAAPALRRDFAAPLEMGSACEEPGNADFQGKNYCFPIPYRHSAARPPSGRQIPAFRPHLPTRCAGEGNGAPVDGKPPHSPLCRPGWECRSPISHLLRRNAWMGPGSSGKEGRDGTNPASQMIFIAIQFLFCGWGRWQ